MWVTVSLLGWASATLWLMLLTETYVTVLAMAWLLFTLARGRRRDTSRVTMGVRSGRPAVERSVR